MTQKARKGMGMPGIKRINIKTIKGNPRRPIPIGLQKKIR